MRIEIDYAGTMIYLIGCVYDSKIILWEDQVPNNKKNLVLRVLLSAEEWVAPP